MPTPRRYYELRNYRWVAQQLKKKELGGEGKSPQELAEEIGCPASSVHWVIKRWLYQDERDAINYSRVHDKKPR